MGEQLKFIARPLDRDPQIEKRDYVWREARYFWRNAEWNDTTSGPKM
jgi:hypothetical protein